MKFHLNSFMRLGGVTALRHRSGRWVSKINGTNIACIASRSFDAVSLARQLSQNGAA